MIRAVIGWSSRNLFLIALATLLIVLAIVPTAVASPRGPGRGPTGAPRTSTRRLLLEGLVVVLAIGGAYLLRERGVGSVSSVAGTPAADPLIAAVPKMIFPILVILPGMIAAGLALTAKDGYRLPPKPLAAAG